MTPDYVARRRDNTLGVQNLGDIQGPKPKNDNLVAGPEVVYNHNPVAVEVDIWWCVYRAGKTGSFSRYFFPMGPGNRLHVEVVGMPVLLRGRKRRSYRLDLVEVMDDIGYLSESQVRRFQKALREAITNKTGYDVHDFRMDVVTGLFCWENRTARRKKREALDA